MTRTLREESGYSLVEVIVAIMILSVAIIPMASMFDAGLSVAVRGSNYDRARAIAGEELEEIKALPYRIDNPAGMTDSAVEFYRPVNNGGAVQPCSSPVDPAFTCEVRTAYLNPTSLAEDGTARTMMSVRVTVTWSAGNYTTTGMASKETR